MKNILTIILVIINSFLCFSQNINVEKKINIIFSINHEILYDLSNLKIINCNTGVACDAKYLPGMLIINNKIYNDIVSNSASYYLTFNSLSNSKSTKNDSYKILLSLNLLNVDNDEYFFCIVEIFDKSYKKVKNRYSNSNKSERYVYDLIFGNYSVMNNSW